MADKYASSDSPGVDRVPGWANWEKGRQTCTFKRNISIATQMNSCLTSGEAELIIEKLAEVRVEDILGAKWIRQHQQIEQLNVQAIVSVSTQKDEFVKDFLVSHDKVKLLVADLIATEYWRHFIFPPLLRANDNDKASFILYMGLYHEAALLNLLETVMYHHDTCDAAGSLVLDVEDYCYRKLTSFKGEGTQSWAVDSGWRESLLIQEKEIQFRLFIKSFTILRYLVDHITDLCFSLRNRILGTHDLPILLIHFLETKPWLDGDKIFNETSYRWEKVENKDLVFKIEGQLWLALYQLLMKSECRQRYEMNNYRKGIVMKLRNHLGEVLLDQIPVLVELKRFTEELAFHNPTSSQSPLFIEELPALRENLKAEYPLSRCREIGNRQARGLAAIEESALRDIAHGWMDSIHIDTMAELEENRCVCGSKATKRCSRCRRRWYCSRECQLGDWGRHRATCH